MSVDTPATQTARNLKWAAALFIPVIGLGLIWADGHRKAQMGTDWDVPVSGYDPRDLLRGHFIAYQYEWPGLVQNDNEPMGLYTDLCIKGIAPVITSVTRIDDVPGNISLGGQSPEKKPPTDCDSIARIQDNTMPEVDGLSRGILFVPQTSAGTYEKKLADPKLQGIIRIRIRDDGFVRPVGMTFKPRLEKAP
jgi:GDYXXLXY protein